MRMIPAIQMVATKEWRMELRVMAYLSMCHSLQTFVSLTTTAGEHRPAESRRWGITPPVPDSSLLIKVGKVICYEWS